MHIELLADPTITKYKPAAQLLHIVAPGKDEYVPAAQLVHIGEPVNAEYVPATQGTQPE